MLECSSIPRPGGICPEILVEGFKKWPDGMLVKWIESTPRCSYIFSQVRTAKRGYSIVCVSATRRIENRLCWMPGHWSVISADSAFWWRTSSWIPWNLSFRYVYCIGQFTPKTKANAASRLLSSLVWIDSGVVVSQHRLESFFHKIKCNGMTSLI